MNFFRLHIRGAGITKQKQSKGLIVFIDDYLLSGINYQMKS